MIGKERLIADVYLAKIPNGRGQMVQGVLFPLERQNEVLACANERVRRQKYYAWKLLEYALRSTFGYEIGALRFTKTQCGKWKTPSCYFSISHSKNAVAVAVSNRAIGVDVEKADAEKVASMKESFLQKVLTAAEREEFARIAPSETSKRTEYLIGKWTAKESVFKTTENAVFHPSEISVDEYSVATRKIAVDGEGYVLSVAAENAAKARYFFDVDLT